MRSDTDMNSSTVIGIIATIAVIGITLAVCFYLISLKDKGDGSEGK